MGVLQKQVETCLEKFRSRALGEADLLDLLAAVERAEARPRRQSLLYVYARNNAVTSPALSISLLEEGKDREGLTPEGAFIYKSAYEAMQDGWRVIKFPEMTLAMDEQNTYGLGFEFILERYV
ncbi:MAG: hypothetical protein EXS64_13755 [Candidatus Latescibacteria bacterium]|nr:hypothetical protein [Candidatus Latescibacterota bacterium]